MLCCTNSSVRWSEIIRDQSASQTSPWREQFWTMNVLKDQLPNVVHCKETLLQNSPSKGQPCFLVKILIKPVYLFNTWEITFSKKNVPYEYQLVVRTNATVYRNQTSSRGWFDWLGRSWIFADIRLPPTSLTTSFIPFANLQEKQVTASRFAVKFSHSKITLWCRWLSHA